MIQAGWLFAAAITENQTTTTDANLTKILGYLALILLVGALLLVIPYLRRRNRLPRSLNTVTLMITLPKVTAETSASEEPQKEEKEMISVAEQVFSNLHAIKTYNRGPAALFGGKYHVSFEIVAIEGEVRFYVATPRKLKAFVEKQILSQYPKAQIDEAGEYNIFKSGYQISGAVMGQTKPAYLPIKTYLTLETDPLNALTNALGKIEKDEGAAIQVIVRPAKPGWDKKGRKIARDMIQGKHLEQVSGGRLSRGLKGASKSLTKPKKQEGMPQEQDDLIRLTPLEEEMVKSIEEKGNKLGFEVNLRVIASAKNKSKADLYLNNILGAYSQFTAPNLNSIVRKNEKKTRLINRFVFRYFNNRRKMILNTEEIASLYHFPTRFAETPNIRWLKAKKAPPPLNIPEEGTYLGINNYRGVETPVRLDVEDRMRHIYIIGKTGTGKSTIMENMAVQDIEEGKGICVVDPHGDLVQNILSVMPKERAEDVVMFEPSDLDRPVGLNMLEYYKEEQKDFVVQEMIAIFYKLFPPEMIGPMFEHNMRNVMLTLMADKDDPGTITEIPRMFTDDKYQQYKVSKVKDPEVKRFWEQEMAQTSDFHKSEMLGYLISKVGRFVENEMMRNIIGQAKSGFNVREIMDNQKILLVNLSKGKTGEVNSDLLGLIIVSKIQMAAMARADIAAEERHDFFLYIDEFQNYITDSIATILSEARKYRLGLNIAHQYIAQLIKDGDTKVRDAVFGNVGSILAYRVGVDDAETFAKEFHPVFDENDVMNVEKYNLYAKLLLSGTPTKPFNIAVPPPKHLEFGNPKLAEAIRQLSRLKYGRDRSIIEAEIMERSQISQAKGQAKNVGAEPTL